MLGQVLSFPSCAMCNQMPGPIQPLTAPNSWHAFPPCPSWGKPLTHCWPNSLPLLETSALWGLVR